jgi:hypothetical protein
MYASEHAELQGRTKSNHPTRIFNMNGGIPLTQPMNQRLQAWGGFPKGKAKLTVSTAASALYIGRALADTNGFQHAEGPPADTVQVDKIPEGGPQCNALLTSEERSVHLGTGTEFILTLQSMPE